jgi:glycosyltransferase involved in cell wall biosynthesis
MTMMRVAHILRKCDPSAWGGTEMAMQRMFNGLRELRVDPIIYCPRLEQMSNEDPLLKSGYRVERFKAFVPVLGLSTQRRRQLVSVGGNLMSFDLISSLWREPTIDVMHAHTLGRLGGIALTVAKQRNIPFVVSIHGGVLDLPDKLKKSFNGPSDQGWEWGKLFGLLFQSHRLFCDAQAIVTCNEKEASLIRERHPGKRIVVQRHGVDVQVFKTDHRKAARAAFPQVCGRRVLLSLGRVDPVKNQSWLLQQTGEVLCRWPDALLVFAGACTDEPYGQEISSRIRAAGLENHVLLTGGIPPNDPRLVGLLQEAAVLILPSLSETFGLVILEAWAAGTPVISSRTSGASALVRHGKNGWLFDLEQPRSFHSALHAAFQSPERARAMAALGHQFVREEFSIGLVASQLKALYEVVVEENQCVA